jgi:Pyrimidine dimer DNA glycosylase
MQTFLPYPDFAASARCLDRQRLGKQRIEVLQLLRALLVPGSGWANHPTAKMWRGHESLLGVYGVAICREWVHGRGYKDTCADKIAELALPCRVAPSNPSWLSDPAFHAAHRSNLLRKDPVHYGQFGWTECDSLPYIWPV